MEDIIEEKIIDVIENVLSIKLPEQIDYNDSLLNPEIGLSPRDLLVVFYALQDAFRIQFDEKDISEKRFDFLDNMVEAVKEKLEASQ